MEYKPLEELRENIYKNQLSLKEIFAGSFSVLKVHFRTIGLLIVSVFLPFNILHAYVTQNFTSIPLSVILLFDFLRFSLGIICFLGIAIISEKAFLGQRLSFREALTHALKKSPKGIATGILAVLAIFGLGLLLVVPGIYAFVCYEFSIFIVSLRETNFIAALKASKKLSQNHFWPVLGKSLGIFIIGGIVLSVLSFPYLMVYEDMLSAVSYHTFLQMIGSYFLVCLTIQYLNLDYLINGLPTDHFDPNQSFILDDFKFSE